MITLGRIIIPGVIITISWILSASPSIGVLNYMINALTGVPRFLNIYSFWGMVWVQALEMTPLAYLLMSAAMQSIDPRLEEASAIAGAGTWPTFRRVTLPLIVPAAAAAALLLFIQTIESFEVPLLLGGRARMAVYTTQVYFNTSRMPTDWGLSSTYSIVLLFLSMALLYRLFPPRAPRRALPNDHWQGLSTAAHRSRRHGNISAVCESIPRILHYRTAFLTMLYASLLPRFDLRPLKRSRRCH